jgi:hypothetical protein
MVFPAVLANQNLHVDAGKIDGKEAMAVLVVILEVMA